MLPLNTPQWYPFFSYSLIFSLRKLTALHTQLNYKNYFSTQIWNTITQHFPPMEDNCYHYCISARVQILGLAISPDTDRTLDQVWESPFCLFCWSRPQGFTKPPKRIKYLGFVETWKWKHPWQALMKSLLQECWLKRACWGELLNLYKCLG